MTATAIPVKSREMLTHAAYEARAVAVLGPDCASWLESGGPYA